MVISLKKIMKLARKWQRLVAAQKRRRISLPRGIFNKQCPMVAEKGHFVVYSADQRRFMCPLSYLSNSIFMELLVMSEQEFGLPGNAPITLPCDATFMDYAVSLIKTTSLLDKEIEQALLLAIAIAHPTCSSPYLSHPAEPPSRPQLIVCGF